MGLLASLNVCLTTLWFSTASQVVVVEVSVPGHSAEQLEVEVAKPLERVLGALPSVRRLSSSMGSGIYRLEIDYGTPPTAGVLREVTATVENARAQLPSAAAAVVSLQPPRLR